MKEFQQMVLVLVRSSVPPQGLCRHSLWEVIWLGQTEQVRGWGFGEGRRAGGSFRHCGVRWRSGGGGRVFGLGVAVSVAVAVAVAVVVLSVLCSVVSPSAVLPVLSALVVGLVVMVAPVTVGSSSYKHRFRTRKTDKESESLRGTQTNFHLTASLVSQTLCYFRNL